MSEETALEKCVHVIERRETAMTEDEFCKLAAQAIYESCMGIFFAATDERKLAAVLGTIATLEPRILVKTVASYGQQYPGRHLFEDLQNNLPAFTNMAEVRKRLSMPGALPPSKPN